MSMMQTLGLGAAGGAGIAAATTGRFATKYAELDQWAEHIAAIDREHLVNHAPLPAIEEPAHPTLRISHGLRHAWWITGLGILVIPPLAVAVLVGTLGTQGSDMAGQFIPGFIVGGLMALIPSALVTLIVAAILFFISSQVTSNRKVEYDIQAQKRQIWEVREQARAALASGIKPASYLEAVGIDPQYFRI